MSLVIMEKVLRDYRSRLQANSRETERIKMYIRIIAFLLIWTTKDIILIEISGGKHPAIVDVNGKYCKKRVLHSCL